MKNNIKNLSIKLCYPVEIILDNIINSITDIKTDNKTWVNHLFYFNSENKCIAYYDKKNKYFYCNYYTFWSKFYLNNAFNYYTIRYLLNSMVEGHFKLSGVTTGSADWMRPDEVEEHFKLSGVTTITSYELNKEVIEEHYRK